MDLSHYDGPTARTAGEQDHSYPFKYAGEDAPAPTNPPLTPYLVKAAKKAVDKLTPFKSVPRTARPWRNCNASLRFVEALNAKYPRRDKLSDGTIGDAAHATRTSDHNPWVVVGAYGVVRARDVDKDGVDAAWIVEELRKLGAAGDPRLRGGGYIIFNRRITKPDFSGWSVYNGSNPHTSHFHISFSTNVAGFDSNAPWTFLTGAVAPKPPAPKPPAPKPTTRPTIKRGSTGPAVAELQIRLEQRYPLYAKNLTPKGTFGPKTEAAVREFQRRSRLTVDGIVGPVTWKALGF